MKQVIRRGLREIIVDHVPDPVVAPQHVLVRPLFSVISSRTRIRTDRSYWFARKGYARQLESFFDAIKMGESVGPTARDGARATLVSLKMLASARSRSPQRIDLEALLGDVRP